MRQTRRQAAIALASSEQPSKQAGTTMPTEPIPPPPTPENSSQQNGIKTDQANKDPLILTDMDRVLMQARTHIRVLDEPLLSKLPPGALKQVVDENEFESACKLSAIDPAAAASRLINLGAAGGPEALLEFASLCLTGPVGTVGTRRSLRSTAIFLLDRIITDHPDFTPALCLKGEAFLPQMHVGKADPETPMFVLKEAYAIFCKAAALGSIQGKFLKARWLITMAPIHKNSSKAVQGKNLVKECAEQNCARALVFLAQCYEFPGRFSPVSFSKDLPASRSAREKVILSLYMRAAELGDADALNDVGSSYATGYGGLKNDFDMAVSFYVRAIRAGSLHAFDNLGTHYETGMSNQYPERIDYAKALHYYRHGARLRCTKCCANLASAYEEGMAGVLPRDTGKAERYYRHTVFLADDDNDAQSASRALKDLVALYVTRIKLNLPDSDCVKITNKKLARWLPKRMIEATFADVNKAIAVAMRGRSKQLVDLIGEVNATQILEYAKDLVDRVQHDDDGPSETDRLLIKHVFGTFSSDTVRLSSRQGKAKRMRLR